MIYAQFQLSTCMLVEMGMPPSQLETGLPAVLQADHWSADDEPSDR